MGGGQFKEVQQAYDILSDQEKRALYDRYGRAAEGMAAAGPRANAAEWASRFGQPGSESFDFSDLFGSVGDTGMMKSAGREHLRGPDRSGARRPAGPPRSGRTQEASLTIPFLTAVRGGETTIDIQRGTGKSETLVVKIPPGVDTGSKVRLKGQGEPGGKGMAAGDLTIILNVEPHPYFKREGRDLQVEVPISVSEAILGAKIDVPTLDGMKSLPIPPGSSSGQKLRLKGQGIPARGQARWRPVRGAQGRCAQDHRRDQPELDPRIRRAQPATPPRRAMVTFLRGCIGHDSARSFLATWSPNNWRSRSGCSPLRDLGLVQSVHDGSVHGYEPAQIRRLWTIVSFQRDLGINLAGVEVILQLFDHFSGSITAFITWPNSSANCSTSRLTSESDSHD